MLKSFLYLKHIKHKIGKHSSGNLKTEENWILTVRKYTDKSDYKPHVRTMKVEECIPPSKRVTIPSQSHKKPPCDGDYMMDNCPEPMFRDPNTHYPPNLVLLAGLSVLAVSIYALKVVGFGDMMYRANIDYETSSEDE